MSDEALELALALGRSPTQRFALRGRPLPADIGCVIQLASGNEALLREVAQRVCEPEATVLEAVRFYLQQVLFEPDADAWRILGLAPGAPHERVREHYRWLQRWLHPDRLGEEWEALYATRVNWAWNHLRNESARQAYDRERRAGVPVRETGTSPAPLMVGGWNADLVERHPVSWRNRIVLGISLGSCALLLVLVLTREEVAPTDWVGVQADSVSVPSAAGAGRHAGRRPALAMPAAPAASAAVPSTAGPSTAAVAASADSVARPPGRAPVLSATAPTTDRAPTAEAGRADAAAHATRPTTPSAASQPAVPVEDRARLVANPSSDSAGPRAGGDGARPGAPARPDRPPAAPSAPDAGSATAAVAARTPAPPAALPAPAAAFSGAPPAAPYAALDPPAPGPGASSSSLARADGGALPEAAPVVPPAPESPTPAAPTSAAAPQAAEVGETALAIAAATPDPVAPPPSHHPSRSVDGVRPSDNLASAVPLPVRVGAMEAVAPGDLVKRIDLARQRVKDIVAYFRRPDSAQPAWRDDAEAHAIAQRERSALRDRNGRGTGEFALDPPIWRMSETAAALNATYHVRHDRRVSESGHFSVDMVWQGRAWQVTRIELRPAAL